MVGPPEDVDRVTVVVPVLHQPHHHGMDLIRRHCHNFARKPPLLRACSNTQTRLCVGEGSVKDAGSLCHTALGGARWDWETFRLLGPRRLQVWRRKGKSHSECRVFDDLNPTHEHARLYSTLQHDLHA